MTLVHFFDIRFAVSFTVFLTIAVLGTLQFVAARHGLVGLSLFGDVDGPYKNYVLGGTLTTGAFAWFFSTHWSEMLRPGPAGVELTLLFGVATLVALSLTLTLNTLLRWLHRQSNSLVVPSSCRAQNVELKGTAGTQNGARGDLEGTLLLPTMGGPHPGIAALCDPAIEAYNIEGLVSHLAGNGFATLLIRLPVGDALDRLESYTMLPAACSFLAEHPEVDEKRIGTLGFGLGADLALRSACSDEHIAATAALTPLLDSMAHRSGLGLLQELSYLESWKWSRFHKKSNPAGGAEEAKGALSPVRCPALVVYGEDDGLIPLEKVRQHGAEGTQVQLRTITGSGHLSLSRSPETMHLVTTWFEKHLR